MSAAIGTHQVADVLHSDALVVFGFTGDLANKKIFPALYAMVKKGLLTVPIIGVASSKLSTQDLCLRVRESLQREKIGRASCRERVSLVV